MICSSCGQNNRGGASFCDSCGASLKLVCPSCGAELRATARFCDACGHSLAEPSKVSPMADPRSYIPADLAAKIVRDRAALEGERRTVTVLFADASGFTSVSERLDEEQVYALMQDCFALMMDSVHGNEGTITQFLGDGVMALFGAPIAHEDSALRAVAAALDMQTSLEQHAAEVMERHGIEFRFRVGLNSGPVVVGKIGENLDMDYTALGDTVNLAARMQQLAEPGCVYMPESTYRLVRDYIECETLGDLMVKGKAEAVGAYKALSRKSVRTRFEAAAKRGLTPFVGRDQELAKRGQGQVVFVSGEAGIGKSRLLLEFHLSASDGDLTWLEGHCISHGRNMPYLPVIDILKRNFDVEEGHLDSDIIARVDEGAADWDEWSSATIPYLKYLLNVDSGDASVPIMDPMERRAGIIDGFRAVLLEASRHRPLVVLVEDLHWVDQQSEQALSAVVDLVATAPILLVLSYRPGYAYSLGEKTYYSRLALGHLPSEERGAMVEGVLQVATLPSQVSSLIIAKGEGNPFYIKEVTKSLVESGVLRKTDGTYSVEGAIDQIRVPHTIQEVILGRIDRLERPAKDAIQLASVFGREFTVRLLDRISGIKGGLEELLTQLKTLELIYEKAFRPELSYMFKHALTHDVAYSTLLVERRTALHRLIGASVEELYLDRLPKHYGTLAHHYYEGQEWDKALEYLVKSAQKAAASFANRDALTYFDRALEVGDRMGAVPDESSIAIYGGKAAVCVTINDWSGVVYNTSCLRELAQAAGNRRLEGLALGGVGFGHICTHEFDLAEAAANEALIIAEELKDDAVRTGTVFVLGMLDNLRGNLQRGLERTIEAALLSQETQQPNFEVFARFFRAINCSWRGLYDEAHPFAAEAVEAGEQHHVTIPLLYSKWVQGLAFGSHGRYDDAIRALMDTSDVCERMGDISTKSRTWNTIGWIHGELCNWQEAIECNQRGLDLAVQLGDPEITSNAQLNLADAAFATGDIDGARRMLEEFYDSLPQLHEWAKWRYSQHMMHSLGEVLLASGEGDRALAMANECLALAEPTETRKNIVKARRLKGQVFLAQGKLPEAEVELGIALEVARVIGNPPQLWKTLDAMGDLYRAQGRPDDASQAYGESLSIIENVAAGLNDDQLRETFLNSDHVQAIKLSAQLAV